MDKITTIRITFSRAKPKKHYPEGSRIMRGKTEYIKVPVMAYEPNGKVIGYACRRGKHLYRWIKVSEFEKNKR